MENINRINEIKYKIYILKDKLRKTDYMAIKYAEGELSAEEYAETKAKRIEWRKEINEMQEELEQLKSSD